MRGLTQNVERVADLDFAVDMTLMGEYAEGLRILTDRMNMAHVLLYIIFYGTDEHKYAAYRLQLYILWRR